MLKQKAGSIVALLFLIFLISYTVANREMLTPLLEVSLPAVCFIALIKVTQIFFSGLFTKITLDAFDKPISHRESAYIALLSSLGNYFGPLLGGMGVRATYLKRKYDFSFTHFVGTLYGYYLITFFTTALIGLLGCWLVYDESKIYSPAVVFTFLGIMLATGILFIVKVPKIAGLNEKKYTGKLYKRFNQVSEGWTILTSSKRLFAKLLLVGFGSLCIGLLTTYIEFKALGLSLTLGALLLYTTLGSVSVLVSFTPGAIGIRETIYIISSSVLMLSNNEILQLAAVDRGVALSVLVLAYIYLQFFGRKMPRAI